MAGKGTKRMVLLVDYEPEITLTLKLGLEVNGLFVVYVFNDPEMALKSFRPNLYPNID
ncbi:MAG: hypothetical protein ACR2IS_08740 [Nitrososphaeraceae archaeon]